MSLYDFLLISRAFKTPLNPLGVFFLVPMTKKIPP